MTKKRMIIIAAAVVLLIGGVVWKNARNGDDDLPVIKGMEAQRKAMEEVLSASGQFLSRDEQYIVSPVNSRIEEVFVEEGAQVLAGEVLMQLDTDDLEEQRQQQLIALEQVELAVRQSLLNLRLEYRSQLLQVQQLRDSHERNQKVHELGNLSDEALRISQDSLTAAEHGLAAVTERLNLLCRQDAGDAPLLESHNDASIIASAPEVAQQRLLLKMVEDQISDCRVTAEMDGVVSRIMNTHGALVTQGMELALVQNNQAIEVEIWIDEVDIGKVKPGDSVEVEADSIIGITLEGSIRSISPQIERIGNSLASRVRISLDNHDQILRPGASCRATIRSLAREDALTIPIEAIKPQSGDILVYRMTLQNDNRYKLEELIVSTGLSTLDEMEILSGLEEGDVVAVSQIDLLRNAMVVQREEEL